MTDLLVVVLMILLPLHLRSNTAEGAPTPCTSYIEINDTRLMTSYSGSHLINYMARYNPGSWYRYTASNHGVLSTSCPSKGVCATSTTVWMNESNLPNPFASSMVPVCVADEQKCCVQANQLNVTNCGDYLVYGSLRLPPGMSLCFNASYTVLSTSSPSTSLSTMLQSTSRSTPTKHQSSTATTTSSRGSTAIIQLTTQKSIYVPSSTSFIAQLSRIARTSTPKAVSTSSMQSNASVKSTIAHLKPYTQPPISGSVPIGPRYTTTASNLKTTARPDHNTNAMSVSHSTPKSDTDEYKQQIKIWKISTWCLVALLGICLIGITLLVRRQVKEYMCRSRKHTIDAVQHEGVLPDLRVTQIMPAKSKFDTSMFQNGTLGDKYEY